MDETIVKKPAQGEPWDVIVLGSGPAALTAAIYTTRGSASTLIVGGEKWGGQLMLTSTVDNYPGFPEGVQGPDLMMAMRKQAERFGAQFLEKNATEVDIVKTPFTVSVGTEKYSAQALIVATGAETVWLDVPGIKELIGRGVSSCAPCDAPFFKDKKVAVVGGGDSAMEEAYTLAKYASEVTIIHRRDALRASAVMQQKVLNNPKIKIMWNSEITEAKGTDKLASLTIKNNKGGGVTEIPFDGLFVAIGHKPLSDLFVGKLTIDEKGCIKNFYDKYHSATSVAGVFVAGDVLDSQYKQAATSVGSGCAAGMDAIKFLEENTTSTS
jgi:thioredoxin reductase (NADPH)